MSVNVQNILILEDDLEALEYILKIIREIQREKKIDMVTTIIPDYEKTEAYINKNPHIKFDILLLDRDCYLGGSFHVIELGNFDLNKVIAISSIPEYNNQVVRKGVKRVVWKDFSNLNDFSFKLKDEILKLI